MTKFVFLIHDNAHPHTAHMSQDLLEQFLRDVFIQLPNCPGLALSDFHLYPHFKQHLSRRHFENEDDLKIKAERWLSNTALGWNDAGLKKNSYQGTKRVLNIMEIM